jgi:biopolymer transport protein ExbD
MNGDTFSGMTLERAAAGARIARFPSKVIGWAAHQAPEPLRDRLTEEWRAHLAELAGEGARLRFALGCLWAAVMIGNESPGAAPVRAGHPAVASYALRPAGRPARPVSPARAASVTHGSEMSEINITPLIDVMLVLLVTLIISLPTMTHAVKLDLPQADFSAKTPPTVVDLDIEADGGIVWNGTVLAGLSQLEAYLQREARTAPLAEIHLRPERRARYDVVAKVLAMAQRNHMEKVAFVETTQFAE